MALPIDSEELEVYLQDMESLLSQQFVGPTIYGQTQQEWATQEALKQVRSLLRRVQGRPLGAEFPLEARREGGGYSLNPPAGFVAYGGVSKNSYPSNEPGNVRYFAQCGRGPTGFGVYVFRQAGPDAIATIVNYGPMMPGRGMLSLAGNGVLEVHGSYDGSNCTTTFTVPGYVRFTDKAPAAVPIPVVNMTQDVDARRMAGEAQETARDADRTAQQARTLAQQIQQQLSQVAARPGMTDQRVIEIIWNSHKVQDLVYAELTNPKSGIASAISQMIAAQIKAAQPRKLAGDEG